MLLGEATFHELHGDLAARGDQVAVRERVAVAQQQDEAIRVRRWRPRATTATAYVGALMKSAAMHFVRSFVPIARFTAVQSPG
jgi:hypothetical protein